MGARSASSSRPADASTVAWTLAAALLLFAATWSLLHHWFWAHGRIIDTRIYLSYGNAIVAGYMPYRDFAVEYPPGALAVFVLPALGHAPADADSYDRLFEALMWLCGGLAIVGMAWALRAVRADGRRTVLVLGVAALSPVLLGSVVLSRFDLVPALLAVTGIAAVVAGRPRVGLVALGAGVAVKLWPGVLIPLALTYVWRRRERREALLSAAAAAAVLVPVVASFLALASHGVWGSLRGQLTRPLQIESLGSAILIGAHNAFGAGVRMASSHGSQNLVGSRPDAFAAVQSLLQIAAIAGLWIAFALRGEASGERLLRYSAATVTAFVALGKVLSPQFLIWLVPLVPLVRGRRGLAATVTFAVACVLTQVWFPRRYFDIPLRFAPFPSWTLLARDLVLLVLLAVLVWPARGPDPA